MSLGSDYLADHYFESHHPFGIPSNCWTTKDGTKIQLKDMTLQHIKNCMRLVGEDDAWYWKLNAEVKKRLNQSQI